MQFELTADDSTDATEPVAPGTSCTAEPSTPPVIIIF